MKEKHQNSDLPTKSNNSMQKKKPEIKVNNEKVLIKMLLERLGQYCPKCGSARDESNFNILGQERDSLIIHIGCRDCGAQDVFHFVANMGYRSAGGLVTDVSSAEAPKFFRSSIVSRDDVLDMYLVAKESETAKDLLKKLSSRRSKKKVRAEKDIPPMTSPTSSYVGQ